jgi:lipopolysaccharide export system permease protein
MGRIERYLFRSAGAATLYALFGVTGMMWVSQAIRELDLVTGQGQTILLFLRATVLIIPAMFLIVAPIALFIGMIVALNRHSSDSELIVVSAAGVSPWRIIRPFALLALIVYLFSMALSLYVIPQAARELRVIITQVRADVITRIIEAGRFVELDRNVMFHYRLRERGGQMRGVMLQDRRESTDGIITTFFAETGTILQTAEGDFLLLEKGSMQRQEPQQSGSAIVKFETYAFDLAQLTAGKDEVRFKPRERLTTELLTMDMAAAGNEQIVVRLKSELHERFAGPLFVFIAAAIAFAALGAPRTTRQGRGLAIVSAIVALVILRSLAFGASTQSGVSWLGALSVYALPVLATVVAAWIGLRQFKPKKASGNFSLHDVFSRFWVRAA